MRGNLAQHRDTILELSNAEQADRVPEPHFGIIADKLCGRSQIRVSSWHYRRVRRRLRAFRAGDIICRKGEYELDLCFILSGGWT
jgi:hypothetical protein